MNAIKVTVVDYGIGNLYSVRRAFETCGAAVALTSQPSEIAVAERLVLPGVGAFADGMSGLRERNLIQPILAYAATGKPLMGICLGMQMLAGMSEEFGEHEGLGLIGGRVLPVPPADAEGRPHKIPHIGWSALSPSQGAAWRSTILDDTPPGTSVYLVHSFHLVPDNPRHLLADCFYNGQRVTASVRFDNIYGVQFHPEKSGPAGQRMLRAFMQLPGAP
jgi:glutamine amidotransferase